MFVRICDICRPMHVINLCTKCKINLSHTRTVVRECCKGDDQSLWEMGKFDPPPPKNPSTDAHQICVGDYVGDIYHQAKFYPNWFRGFRFCAYVISRPSAQSDSAIFGGWVLEKGYSQDARTNFDSKYVKRRGSTGNPCKEVLFGGRETNIWGLDPHCPKTPFLSPISTELRFFSPENGFNIGRPLIVVGAQ